MSTVPHSAENSHFPTSSTGTNQPRAQFDAVGNARLTDLGRSAYLQALEDGWADHRRLHAEGRKARRIFDASRETIASLVGARTEEIFFAPSATAAFHALLGSVSAGRKRSGDGAVVSAVERSAILNAADYFARRQSVPVDRLGKIALNEFSAELEQGNVAWAATHVGNHEVGTLQPIAEISELTRSHGVPLILDAAAAAGHTALPPAELWDALVAQPSDWGAGQGVGVLALKSRTRTRAVWPEDQDAWFPGGTSLPAIFAAAVTLDDAIRNMPQRSAQQSLWIDQIRQAAMRIPDVEVVGDPSQRLPHVLTFSCLYVDGEALTTELDRRGFAVGSGSACTSHTLEPSHVLAAMGVLTHGNVRVTLDAIVTQDQVDRFIFELPDAVATVRKMMGVDDL